MFLKTLHCFNEWIARDWKVSCSQFLLHDLGPNLSMAVNSAVNIDVRMVARE